MESPDIETEQQHGESTLRHSIADRLVNWLVPEINKPPNNPSHPASSPDNFSPQVATVVSEGHESDDFELVEINPPKMETDLGPIRVKDNGDSPPSIQGPGALGVIPESVRALLPEDNPNLKDAWYSGRMTTNPLQQRSYRKVRKHPGNEK